MISNEDVPDVYLVPAALKAQGLDTLVCQKLGLPEGEAELGEWLELIERINERSGVVEIALVGKYVKLHDAYLSVHEALKHAGATTAATSACAGSTPRACRSRRRGASSSRSTACSSRAASARAGGRARSSPAASPASRIPYLGICLGMHVAVSEFARHVSASTARTRRRWIPETPYPVIDLLPEQKEVEDLGGTMRLGAQAVELAEGTRARETYGEPVVHERHRHRYEVNNHFRPRLVEAGLVVSGTVYEGGWSRSSSSPIIRGSWRASSTRSSSRGRPGRRRSSATSSVPLGSRPVSARP